MLARVSCIAVTIVALFCVYISAQLVSQTCLNCLCEANTECNADVGCRESICGPFSITKYYWADAGKPTVNDIRSNDDDEDFRKCANDVNCAGRAVQGYMAKYSRDCTGDFVVDCDDYVRLHQLGPNGCTGSLDSGFENKYKQCI